VIGIRTVVTAGLLLGVGGCAPSIYPVEGVVLLDGEPLEGATVVFQPEGPGQPAVATTQADGGFKISTAAGKGAAPGDYAVTLTKVTGRQPDSMPPWIRREGAPATAQERADWQRKKAEEKAQETEWIPAPYLKTSTTPFHFTVPVDGKLTLELSSEEE
jgi:hypothetical protein